MFKEEKRLELTSSQIKKDLIGGSWFMLSIGAVAFIASLILVCCTVDTVVKEIKNFDSTLVSYYNMGIAIIGELVLVAMLVVTTVYLVPGVKRIFTSISDSFLVSCDELEYITTEDVVVFSWNKYRPARTETIDILHFKKHGRYKLKIHPTQFEGGEKFYLIISKKGKKIYNIYSQKTYFYRK